MGGGLTLATLVWALGSISGGHLNPAVTIAFLLTGKTNPLLAALYILSQLVGAIAGAALLIQIAPLETAGKLSLTQVHPDITLVQAWGVETIITFILVLTVFRLSSINLLPHCSIPKYVYTLAASIRNAKILVARFLFRSAWLW